VNGVSVRFAAADGIAAINVDTMNRTVTNVKALFNSSQSPSES
jgi:hypothetical protein